jgi:hypothetical protein
VGKVAQRQVVASIVPVSGGGHETGPRVEGYFAQVSGGEITASAEKVYSGGNQFPELLCAPAEIGDLTVTRHWDPADDPVLQKLRQLVGRTYYDVTVVTLDCDLAVPGSDRIYPRCLLVGVTEPEGDASSGAPATYALTFSVSTISPPS